MVKILTILAIVITAGLAVSAPYIAAILYSAVSILQPQYIWFWVFDDILIFKISAGIAIVAWGIYMLRGGVNWGIYNNGIFYGVVMLLPLYYLSDFFSPFQSYNASVGSDLVISIYNTIVIMFFIVLGLINHERALKFMALTIVVVTIYYTYWANNVYLSGDWSQFSQGRLLGPPGSPYRDGNVFSIVFVVGLPFVLFAIYQVDKTWQKVLLILSIPLIWHAMLLCASRGALLAAGVSTIVAATMIKSKSLNILLVIGFVVFLVDQGGVVLDRTKTTAASSQRGDAAPINPRIVSWTNAIGLVKKYPILGAGPQRFVEATRAHFPATARHVAHNTFFNFAANLGLIAAFIYLSFFWIAWKMYRWNKKVLDEHGSQLNTYINKAGLCSIVGFFVGSMFLDLIIFEPFFFLLLILIVNNFLLKQKVADNLLKNAQCDEQNGSPAPLLSSHPYSRKRNHRV
jgi:hypothetical protein